MKSTLLLPALSFLLIALLPLGPAAAATVIYTTDFEALSPGSLATHPGTPEQDWWYGQVTGEAVAEINASAGHPGQCLNLLAPASNNSGVQTYGQREVLQVDLTDVKLISLSFDFYCTANDLTTQNLYRAQFACTGGPHPGYAITTLSLVGGHSAPRDQTGVNVEVANYVEGVGGGLPYVPLAGQGLAWDTWHTVQVVIDQAADRYVSVTIDGETEDISQLLPPRSLVDGDFLRGQLLEKIHGVIYSNEWGDPLQETDDWVRFDNISLEWSYASEPAILGVDDVGNDQGRQVRLSWLRAESDGPAEPTIQAYDIYRRQDAGRLVGWDYVMSVPAAGDERYQCVVPTLGDSTAAGIVWSSFLLRAMTTDPLVFFQSEPDSGYSVDNLSPEAAQDFTVTYTSDGVDLAWSESPVPDFLLFRVYRGDGLRAETLIAETAGTNWHDDAGTYAHVYSLVVVDDAGNESLAAEPVSVSGAPDLPGRWRLYPARPNPFNPSTTLIYQVPAPGGLVQIGVYDVTGRLVKRLVKDHQDPGPHEIVWRGTDELGRKVAAGVYFARLTAPSGTLVRKMVLLP